VGWGEVAEWSVVAACYHLPTLEEHPCPQGELLRIVAGGVQCLPEWHLRGLGVSIGPKLQ